MTTATARCPISASTLTGDDIKNRNDEVLGSVHDIMLDCSTGKVAYVVMTSGGFLGMGNKLFAIPMTALDVDTDQKCLRLDAKKETFEARNGFDKENWPNFADKKWETSVHEHFKARPYWNA